MRAPGKIAPFKDPSVQLFDRALGLRWPTSDDAVGEEGIVQRLTLPQELRIRYDAQAPKSAVLKTVARPDRNGGPDNHECAIRCQPTDLGRRQGPSLACRDLPIRRAHSASGSTMFQRLYRARRVPRMWKIGRSSEGASSFRYA